MVFLSHPKSSSCQSRHQMCSSSIAGTLSRPTHPLILLPSPADQPPQHLSCSLYLEWSSYVLPGSTSLQYSVSLLLTDSSKQHPCLSPGPTSFLFPLISKWPPIATCQPPVCYLGHACDHSHQPPTASEHMATVMENLGFKIYFILWV